MQTLILYWGKKKRKEKSVDYIVAACGYMGMWYWWGRGWWNIRSNSLWIVYILSPTIENCWCFLRERNKDYVLFWVISLVSLDDWCGWAAIICCLCLCYCCVVGTGIGYIVLLFRSTVVCHLGKKKKLFCEMFWFSSV